MRVRLVLALPRARPVSSVSLRSFSEDTPRPSASRVSRATNRARPSSDAHVRRVAWDLRLGSKGNQSGFVLRIEGNENRVEKDGVWDGGVQGGERAGSSPFERKPSPFNRPIERTVGPFRWGGTQPFAGSIPWIRYLFHLPSRSEGKIAMVGPKGIDGKRRGMQRVPIDETKREETWTKRTVRTADVSATWHRSALHGSD